MEHGIAHGLHAFATLGTLAWLELGLFIGLNIMLLSALAWMLVKARRSPPGTAAAPPRITPGLHIPELRLLLLALPLELLWEIAQFPLYNVWHQNDWSYILYGLIHCTLGDLLILLIAYELVALVRRDRAWYRCCTLSSGLVFTLLGLAYTIYSESVHVRIKCTWSYTELMPLVPGIEIGGMPFLQWLLIPPILLWLMRMLRPA